MSGRPVVHLVSKTHLDVGFTALAAEVVDRYVEHFIPSALATAAHMREEGDDRFVWTTGSWLVDTFLERADATGRRAMEDAIAAGDIAWHALPFTLHSELCDASLFAHGLTISRRLDERFGRTTIAAKMTDVPGHTIGIVPLLAEAGVELLHIGVNPACPVPDVPPVFRWRAPDGSEVVVAYQAGGYGGMVAVDGMADRLLVCHTDDNKGPQTVEQARADLTAARADAPDFAVQGSTLDAFAIALRPLRDDLPVVSSEIGDTWIHGVGTDPQKVARFRELSRLRAEWIADGLDSSSIAAASTRLLLVAEHTWGLDEKIALPDDHRYAGEAFAELRASREGQRFEASWAEQRAYLDEYVALLPAKRRAEARDALAALATLAQVPGGMPGRPESSTVVLTASSTPLGGTARPGRGPTPVFRGSTELHRFAGRLVPQMDHGTGALVSLVDQESGREWADTDHPLGLFRHQSFDGADYDRFHRTYNQAEPHDEWWAVLDYTKPNIDAAGAVAGWREAQGGASGWSGLALGRVLRLSADAIAQGCPPQVRLQWTFDATEPVADLVVSWFEKPAARLPEASWVSFAPIVDDPSRWTIDKLDRDVSPLDVVRLGGRHLHAVGHGMRHVAVDGTTVSIETLDAPLVAPGQPRLLDPTDAEPDLAGGMHVNLHNNVWGTNFPMWNEGPAQFRFRLRFGPT